MCMLGDGDVRGVYTTMEAKGDEIVGYGINQIDGASEAKNINTRDGQDEAAEQISPTTATRCTRASACPSCSGRSVLGWTVTTQATPVSTRAT